MLNIALNSPDLERFVSEQLSAGTYASADELVATALTLLQSDPDANLPAQDLAALRHEIDIGLDQANRGEFSAFTAEDIIAEGTQRIAARNAR